MREAQGPRVSGVSGRETRGGAGAGALIPSGVGAGEVVGRQRAPVPTRSGEQGRGEGGGGLGRGRGCGPVWAGGAVGGKRAFFPFFFLFLCLGSVFSLFAYSLFCFISFKSI